MKKIILILMAALLVTGCTSTTEKEPEEKTIVCEFNMMEEGNAAVVQNVAGEDNEFNADEQDLLENDVKIEMTEKYTLVDGEVVSVDITVTASGWTENSLMSKEEYEAMLMVDEEYEEAGVKTTVTSEEDKVITTTVITYADVSDEMMQFMAKTEEDVLGMMEYGYICK